ncbi:hypothetical protein [Pedobacter nanyangensis]|uniref:hypothetical protein n=1 Tax=Pedobacter nanyangensis TaxID=1562389 RepID=UPI000DE4447B|nr:hypothetical protein [Pedobacter nanyangensis]
MTNILIVCSNEPIAATIARLINKMEDWHATVALSLNEAMENCYAKAFEVILIGSGITQPQEDVLKLHLEKLKANSTVVKHYGGGSGLLYAEIYQALADK